MNHLMLDLETLGTAPDAAIVAIGAVAFDPHTSTLGDTFYRVVDIESATRDGGTVNGNTIRFWIGQSDAARRELLRADTAHINGALHDFFGYCEDLTENPGDLRVWGNGAAFDNVILRSCYARHGSPAPWQHWNDRCYRTVRAFYPHIKKPEPAIPHHALEDARAQAQHLLAMLAATPQLTP